MTTTLILFRHAQRDSQALTPDDRCPISAYGKACQEKLCQKLDKEEAISPNIVLYSPTLRTEQTAQIIASYFHIEAKKETALGLSGEDNQKLLKLILPQKTTAFVGHAPSLMLLLHELMGKMPPISEIRTSSAVILQFDQKISFEKAQFVKYLSA
jgi:phosphohistidine phosphatase SixA